MIGQDLPRAVSVIAASHGKVDPAVLLGMDLHAEDVIDARRTHHDGEAEHDHDDFASFAVPVPEIGEPDELVRRVDRVVAMPGVLRVKGFVAVDGTSLTITARVGDTFSVALVAYTQTAVTLAHKQPGERVNLEVDVIAKYVESLLRRE